MTSPDHPDPTAETTQRLAQGLAILATLAEAGARLAAEHLRYLERQRELAARRDDLIDQALSEQQDLAARVSKHREAVDRRRLRDISDKDIANAKLRPLAELWRLARSREGRPGFEHATHIAETVENRLRQRWPALMSLYDELVAAGLTHANAMHLAIQQVHIRRPRPHGNPSHPALTEFDPGTFDNAVRSERARFIHGTSQDARDHFEQQLRQLRTLSPAAEQAVREILAARAEKARHQAAADAATPDRPETPMNENLTDGRTAQATDQATAERDATAAARTAPQVAADFYPDGPVITVVPPSNRPSSLNHRRPADYRQLPQRNPRQTR